MALTVYILLKRSLTNPFIVKLYFAFETTKRLYLVQEFCRGGELFRRMEVERMMLEEHAKFYLSQIVCALEYLHSIDIVYRDLKTENVMLDQDGHVKLIDFGLSKLGMNDGVLTNTFCGTGESLAMHGILLHHNIRVAASLQAMLVLYYLMAQRRPLFVTKQSCY